MVLEEPQTDCRLLLLVFSLLPSTVSRREGGGARRSGSGAVALGAAPQSPKVIHAEST